MSGGWFIVIILKLILDKHYVIYKNYNFKSQYIYS